MPETAFIYGLLDPRNGELRYVGKTVSEKVRMSNHLSARDDTPKSQWITELAELGLSPKFITLAEVEFDKWQQEERETINRYRRLGCQLLNVKSGGGANPQPARFNSQVPFCISDDLLDFYKQAAERERRTLSATLRIALQDHKPVIEERQQAA